MNIEELQEKQEKQRKISRDLLLILLLLLLGVCIMCVAGQVAIKLAPTWVLEADMGSGLDPNVDYALRSNPKYIEPILPGILDSPAWIDVFLTPGAYIPNGENQQPIDIQETPPPNQDTSAPRENPQPTKNPTVVVVIPPSQPPNPKPPVPPKPPGPPPEPPSDVQVNLKATNTDGQSTYLAGSTVVYSIIVTNSSTNDIIGAVIQDNIPAQVASWNWVCKAIMNASGCDGVTGSSSNFTDTVNIQAGGSIQYEVTAFIKASATGDLVNKVTLSIPSGYVDTDLSDNSATDTDTLSVVVLPSADLAITKTDGGGGTYVAGAGITYTIEVTNYGPGNASGFNITDNIPTMITGVSVSCTVTGTASCGTNTTVGNAVSFTGASINAGIGNKITITLSGTVSSGVTGTVSNRVDIAIPGGASFTDPVTANNYDIHDVTQSTLLSADLAITKTDGSDSYTPGSSITYTITVTNNGPDNASGFNITDTVPTAISISSISCTTTGTASCGTNGSSGNNLSFTFAAVNAGAGNQIIITLNGTVDSGASGTLMNTAMVSVPAGYTDPNTGNNSETDINGSSTEPDVGPPDGYWFDLPADRDLIFNLGSSGITFTGNPDSDYDLVYFERYYPDNFNPQDVRMDCVQVQIGRNNSPPYDQTNDWYTIFFWCDGSPDTNTNVNINIIGGAEDDNRIFLPGSLYGIPIPPYNAPPYNSGVTIDVHAPLVAAGAPNGDYRHLRIFSPVLGDGDAANIDSIYMCPGGGC